MSINIILKERKYRILIGIVLTTIVAILLGIIYDIYLAKRNMDWKDKIYNGITIGDVDVSGRTKDEAMELLQNDLIQKLKDKDINISVDDYNKQYKYEDLDIEYDLNDAVENAVNYGKNFSNFKQSRMTKENYKHIHNVEINFEINRDKLNDIKNQIRKETAEPFENAKVNIVNDEVQIEEGKDGLDIDDDDFENAFNENINADIDGETNIKLDLVKKEPEIKAEDLSDIKNKMSSFTTDYSSSASSRAYNVEFATSLVNGTILMPGEEFSYSKITQTGIGKYKDAPVYINNKVEQAEAGGICQVSTTLYRAVMRANIRSTERINHSLPVGYAKLGLDATVAWGSLDYKFKNTYDIPIYIQGIAKGGTLTFNIYGDIDKLENKTYDMENEIIETIEPPVEYIDDASMNVGTEVTETYGNTGYRVKSYQITYENGKEINREVVATDTYAATSTVIRRGTKPLEQAPQGEPNSSAAPNQTEEQNPTNQVNEGIQGDDKDNNNNMNNAVNTDNNINDKN